MKLKEQVTQGRVVIIARPEKGPTSSVTVYDTTPDKVIAQVKALAMQNEEQPNPPQTSPRRRAS